MTTIIKRFIEDNIEFIQQSEFEKLYELANNWLSDSACSELTRTLEAALDMDIEQFAKDCAMKNFKHELNTWATAFMSERELYLTSFFRVHMTTICGIDWDEFQQMVCEYLDTKPYKNVSYIVDGEGDVLLIRGDK